MSQTTADADTAIPVPRELLEKAMEACSWAACECHDIAQHVTTEEERTSYTEQAEGYEQLAARIQILLPS